MHGTESRAGSGLERGHAHLLVVAVLTVILGCNSNGCNSNDPRPPLPPPRPEPPVDSELSSIDPKRTLAPTINLPLRPYMVPVVSQLE